MSSSNAKSFINMRKDELRRRGCSESQLSDQLIKSFGGKILKRQGWKIGTSLKNSLVDDLINPIQ